MGAPISQLKYVLQKADLRRTVEPMLVVVNAIFADHGISDAEWKLMAGKDASDEDLVRLFMGPQPTEGQRGFTLVIRKYQRLLLVALSLQRTTLTERLPGTALKEFANSISDFLDNTFEAMIMSE